MFFSASLAKPFSTFRFSSTGSRNLSHHWTILAGFRKAGRTCRRTARKGANFSWRPLTDLL